MLLLEQRELVFAPELSRPKLGLLLELEFALFESAVRGVLFALAALAILLALAQH